MDEKDFALLRMLDETRNITRAAEKLYMTQSALSKRIKAIEEELRVELLLRSRQGIRFTPAGERILARSQSAAREMELMRRELSISKNEVAGTLRAGISINYALYCLPRLLVHYHKKYPKVQLDITTGHSRHLYKQLLDGTLDIAILRGEYPWDGPQFLLSQESIYLIYSREYQGIPLEDYLYVGHRTDSIQTAQTARWLREHHLENPRNHICVDSITTCVEMVRSGLGWGLIPEIALKDFDGIVVPCTFENGEAYLRRTYVLCQKNALELPQVKLFADAVKKNQGR